MRKGFAALSDISEELANRRWEKVSTPFTHFLAHDVFKQSFYIELETAFRAARQGAQCSWSILPCGMSCGLLPKDQPNPLHIFHSRDWHDLLVDLLKIDSTGDVRVELHVHRPASPNGQIHNDLNPGWFAGTALADEMNLAHPAQGYTGRMTSEFDPTSRQVVRAATMIFYLCNPNWERGEGGETGLYHTADSPVTKPAVIVPPRNNSLLVFPCSPSSYHAFLSNRRADRSSLVLWLHQPLDRVVKRWGHNRVVQWPL